MQESHCIHVAAPFHTQCSRRGTCGSALYRSGAVRRPILVYPYISIVESLKAFLARPGFSDACRLIASESSQGSIMSPSDLFCDIYDGSVWQEFITVNGKHTIYSVGAIYVTILNLPRHMRYKVVNTILVGIVPGPREPSLHINSFLSPLVLELLQLWEGIQCTQLMDSHGSAQPVTLRAALLSVVCDIPGLAKVAGYLGHSARLGCTKCLKPFPTAHFGEKPDFSGFNRDQWPKRDTPTHRHLANQYKTLPNRSQQKAFESEHGLRYSELLQLP